MMSALSVQQKPEALSINFDGIPSALKNQPHWVLWRYEETKNGKWTKPPLQVNGWYADPSNPATWVTFDDARAAYEGGGFDGIGVMMRDGFCGIDLDHVLSPNDSLESWAQEIVDQYPETYIERSPSGDGLHILATGKLPFCGKTGPGNRLELYDERSPRYFTVTGQSFGGAEEITDQQDAIDWLSGRYPKESKADQKAPPPTDAGASKLLDDAAMLTSAMQTGGERFRKLFDGDFSDYPSQSEGELALANMLARVTQDAETLDRLFRVSELCRPEKWDKPHSADGQTYGQMTIAKALSGRNAMAGAQAAREALPDGPRKYEFVHASDFMAETITTEWLIDGILEQNTTCTLFGASGSGKSFVAMEWACCVATGTDWHGQEVEPGVVFYIVGEGLNGFRRRLKVWEKTTGVLLEGKPFHVLKNPVQLSDRESVECLSETIAGLVSADKPCMIVIDTLARSFGDGDENSNADVNKLMSKIDANLRIPFNASIVLVHHSGNSDKDRARGASALKAAMDHEYRVDKRASGLRVLQCTKMKDGPEDFEFHFQIEGVSLGGDESGGALVPLDVPTSKKAANEKLTKPAITCYQVLGKIADPFGVPPSPELVAAEGMFAPALVVHEDRWMPMAIEAGISQGSLSSQKRAFVRAVDLLLATDRVGKHGNYYWVKS